ncbi:FAD-dependent oxidoreductase [Homoserinimonas sp. A520]
MVDPDTGNSAPAWDEEVDFISVGSGGGGLVAAYVAQLNGATSVVLEKRAVFGGATAMSGGILWAPANHLMRREGVQDSYKDALMYLEAAIGDVGPASSEARRRSLIAETNEIVELLADRGVIWERATGYSDYHDLLPGGKGEGRGLVAKHFDLRRVKAWRKRFPPRKGRYKLAATSADFAQMNLVVRTWKGFFASMRVVIRTAAGYLLGREPAGVGAALMGRILELALSAGADIRMETEATALVEERGRVVGVIARHGGRSIRIRARKGVLIATAGYSRNLALREATLPRPTTTEWSHAPDGDTGDGLRMAVDVGAAVANLDDAWWMPTTVMPTGKPAFLIGERFKPHSLMVDQAAQRFVNEAASYMLVGQTIYRHNDQTPSIPSWMIFDARHRRRYLWGVAFPGLTPREWIESGYMLRDRTLAGLATQCGLDSDALQATVDRFNVFARAGIDDDFHRGESMNDRYYGDPRSKPNPSLGTLERAPFYAVRVFPGDVGTSGGILTDERARVLDGDGQPIAGLYATGNATASVSGRTYVGPGITIAATIAFGHAAAKHAVGLPPARWESS